ncbi:MAG: 2-enoyl thioester reductase domain-containing protein [Opitutales bacterium]|jgi:mitochondrial enoyl-[acyl-carrier protein] reductase / trans-2-enoyl-CoA reductase|nr:2-enoyl thioester reductase domain-containing protein [Opitutales bacterium]
MARKSSQSIRYNEFGKPNEVLFLEEQPVPEPSSIEVVIKLLASPINPSDIGSILGKYGTLKELPATAGLEGIGEIVELGSAVTSLSVGQWVQMPESSGVWKSHMIAPAQELRALPSGLDAHSASMASVNPPTAIRLLEDYGDLQPGDWVIQNGANSNLGIAVIQYAKKLGLKSINVVRREELKQPLKDLGADVVVTEDDDYHKEIESLIGGPKPKLALNSIGGESAMKLLNSLCDGGTHVTFGAMTFDPIRFPTRQLIFNDIRICGFWLTHWRKNNASEEDQALSDQVYSLIGDGTFKFPVAATYPLDEFQKALEHVREPRLGKVLLTGE